MREISAEHAAALYERAYGAGIRCWVMGGWGVDALLGTQTRPHHDLDLLVLAEDLPRFDEVMTTAGFVQREVGEDENEWITLAGAEWPTAFVMSDASGCELDVHAVEISGRRAIPRCAVPWTFPDGALEGNGVIGGTTVACLSVEGQLGAHTGYEPSENHVRDMTVLTRLRGHS